MGSNEEVQDPYDKTRENLQEKQACYVSLTKACKGVKISKLFSEIRKNPDSKFTVKCEPCDDTALGYFNHKEELVLCQNQLTSQKELENTLLHELIHAYDYYKMKSDLEKCSNHACSEIRAASLSDDCTLIKEFRRGNFKLKDLHKNCVKRRALVSIQFNPDCNGKSKAQQTIEENFERCYNDFQPFTSRR